MTEPSPEEWRALSEQFAKLSQEENKELAPGFHPYIDAYVHDVGDGRHWTVKGPKKNRVVRFQTLASRAARLIGMPQGGDLVDAWLERLCLDLLQQRKEGLTVNHLRSAEKPGDPAIIDRVCLESEEFSGRLESKALAHEDRVARAAQRASDRKKWAAHIPPDLLPAITYLRETFRDSHYKHGIITQKLCYGLLHDGFGAHESIFLAPLQEINLLVGPESASRFQSLLKQATPPSIFKGFFDLYLDAVTIQAKAVFKELLAIGQTHSSRLGGSYISWAFDQTSTLIRDHKNLVAHWVQDVCDKPGPDGLGGTDFDSWEAPLFLLMTPSRDKAYNPDRVWLRIDARTSSGWLDMFAGTYVSRLGEQMRREAGEAELVLARSHHSGSGSFPGNKIDESQRAVPSPSSEQSAKTSLMEQAVIPAVSPEGKKRQTPARKRRSSLGPDDLKRRQIIFGAIEDNLTGIDYARDLERRGLEPKSSWVQNGCPDTYTKAWRDSKWKQSVANERSDAHKLYKRMGPKKRTAILDEEAWG